MNKLSITLPLGAQVCIESDDRELVREVLHSFMPQLVAANGASGAPLLGVNVDAPSYSNGHNHDNGNGHRIPAEPTPTAAPTEPAVAPPADASPQLPVVVQPIVPAPAPAEPRNGASNGSAPVNGSASAETMPIGSATPGQLEFVAFCQRVNPVGDMRKVVVAAEAAHRYLNIDSVDPDELSRLFALAGWPMPHNFQQTLRNSARSKFRWLEKVPGRSGHYKVSSTGRSIVLGAGQAEPDPE